MLEKLFRSRAEVRVLGVALFHSGLHLREIARRAGISPYETKRELDLLVSIGVLVPEKKGNLMLFHPAENCPFLPELRSLYTKTEGIAGLLKERLSSRQGMHYAFLFGSFARQTFSSKSDVDLLVIGSVEEDQLSAICAELQTLIGREINYILWSEGDFKDKIRKKGAFIKSVLKKETIWIAGDEHAFRRAASKALD